jgi:hypothetical protein
MEIYPQKGGMRVAQGVAGSHGFPSARSLIEAKDWRNMSATLSRIECDEFEVKLIGITPDTPIELEPGDSDAILCFDLSAFGPERVVDWIRRTREVKLDAPDAVLPTFVVIGKLSRMSLESASEVLKDLRAVGASYYEWPDRCHTFRDAIKALGAEANQIYRMFIRSEEGFRPAAAAHMIGDMLAAPELQNPARETDLSVYSDPPVRLSDEDFRRLVRRMDADSSDMED